jgi:ketosteroid isomerase-like protein
MKRDVPSIIVDGVHAVVQLRLTATTHGGIDYANEYCWVYTCRDDRVQLLEEYADTWHAARLLGLIQH